MKSTRRRSNKWRSKGVLLFFTSLMSLNVFGQLEDYYIERSVLNPDSTYDYEIFIDNQIDSRMSGVNADSHQISLYSDGELDGPLLVFEDGQLNLSSFFEDGMPVGTELSFQDSGRLAYIINRNSDGQMHGLYFEFNESGQLSLIMIYEKGVMKGLLYNAKNKGFAPPPVELSKSDSTAWRLNLDRNLIEKKKD